MTGPMFFAFALATASSAHSAVQAPPRASAPIEFLFDERGVYPLVAAPGRVTDIALEPGETLVETNPIAAGDTARWIIGDTSSGAGETRRVHVLVKPTAADLSTNLIVNTTRRTYFLELRASDRAFLTQVRWRYTPPPPIVARSAPEGASQAVPLVDAPPAAPPSDATYRIRGRAPFRPLRVWDDGARTYLEFAPAAATAELPPLFVVGDDGESVELVNYGVVGRTLIVERLFRAAELRLGSGRNVERVRIERRPARWEAVR